MPWANDGISNTPSGPFQNTVFAGASASSIASRDCSPRSTMCHDAGNFSVPTVLYSVPRVTSLATTTSVGRMTWTPASSAAARIRRASSTRSCSARLLPTTCPGRAGTCWPSRRRGRGGRPCDQVARGRLILSETLAPPRIAANGRAGLLEEAREHPISRSISSPA